MGPLLFLIFVNDIPSSIGCSQIFLFADDAKCLKKVSTPSDCRLLQNDLLRLSLWSQKWHLQFNAKKCVVLRFSPKFPRVIVDYTINNTEIQVLNCHRDLGILLSSDLKWNNHLKFIASRAYKVLGLIRRSFSSGLDTKAKKNLYILLVRSQLSYGSQIWRPHLVKDIIMLERIQRRATKYILNDYKSDYKHRLLSLRLLPLVMQLELYDIMFFIRCLKTPDPSNTFPLQSFLHFSEVNTRSSTHLKLMHSLCKSNVTRHLYFNRLPRLWNSLPPIKTFFILFLPFGIKFLKYFGHILNLNS